MTRMMLALLTVASLQTPSATGAASSSEPQAASMHSAEARIGASIKEAITSGRLVTIEDGDLKVDKAVAVPDELVKGSTSGHKAEILYQIGTSKENTPVFLPVRTATTSSEESGKVIDGALSTLAMDKAPLTQIDVQACAGDRTCVKVCGAGAEQHCCKWQCDKP